MWACAGAVVLGGCAVGAVDITELNFKRMYPQGPLVRHVPVTEAWWWIEGGRVLVALQEERGRRLSEYDRKEFDVSLVFDGLPAAKARSYAIGRDSVRGYHRDGARHSRFASSHGVAGLWFESGGVLRGRFRMIARRQVFHILTGWSDSYQAAVVGEFRARENRARGEPILLRTEEDGMERRYRQVGAPTDRPGPQRVEGPAVVGIQ